MANKIEKFYADLLSIKDPWIVAGVDQNMDMKEVTIRVTYDRPDGTYKCPVCGRSATLHDIKEQTIRYLDTCEMKTYLMVKCPRVMCLMCNIQLVTFQLLNAKDVAKQRLDSYLNEKLADAWDMSAWEFYTYLLEQAKKHPLVTTGYASMAYKADKKEALNNYNAAHPDL